MSGRLLEFSPQPIGPAEADQVRVSNVLLWFGALGAPIAWAIHLVAVYFLTEVACRFETKLPLYGASALLFAVATLAGLVCWYYLRYMRQRNGATVPRRIRFMATAGLAGAILFMVAIAGGTLPMIVDDPCQLPGRRPASVLPHI